MKKMLLITRHAVPNYGSFLQTLATVKVFEKKGYKVNVLDYVPKLEQPRYLYIPMMHGSRFNKNIITKFAYQLLRKPDFRAMGKKFRDFQMEELPLTKEYNELSAVTDDINGYDIYVTGSDQVWGPIALSQYDGCYFWNFLPDDKKILSYSASFGNTDFSEKIMQIYADMLKKYSEITVRENSAIELIKKMGLKTPKQVLDPTLMFSKDFWDSYVGDSVKKEKYALVYQVHDNKQMEKYAKELAKKQGITLVRISNSMAHIFRGGKFVYLPSPKGFLSLIRDAEYVITNSFHATVFSLLFERQFSIIDSGNTNTRISSLLELVNLKSRQIRDYDDFSQINRKIDYNEVEMLLENARVDSNIIIDEILRKI